MTPEPLNNSMTIDDGECRPHLCAEKPTIKILLYTDDPHRVTEDETKRFSLGRMMKQLETHAPFFARPCVKLISRSTDLDHHADNKLDDVLVKEVEKTREPYDQIWFFGLHQVNKKEFTLDNPGGGPHSELEENEVKALKDWMRVDPEKQLWGGGVLMTGDHANPRPVDALATGANKYCPKDSSHEPFLGLGRALGHCVPRAGLLRKWEGSPTQRVDDSYNTQVLAAGTNIENQSHQADNVPQQLILETFVVPENPNLGKQPHPLFLYKKGEWIQVFPDHLHEGAVVIPDKLDRKVWPKCNGVQPKPRVIAYGLDKRNGRKINVLAAYDGDCAEVGRIVADSSWHHYFNINLENFSAGAAAEDPVADQIGQFYGNLAVWLSPFRKRYQMACAMFQYLANHPLMLEEVGNDVLNIGRTAYHILSQVASPCEINELLRVASPKAIREEFEILYFPEKGYTLDSVPSKELILGYVVDEYHTASAKALSLDGSYAQREQLLGKAIRRGFDLASKKQVEEIEKIRVSAQRTAKFFSS